MYVVRLLPARLGNRRAVASRVPSVVSPVTLGMHRPGYRFKESSASGKVSFQYEGVLGLIQGTF